MAEFVRVSMNHCGCCDVRGYMQAISRVELAWTVYRDAEDVLEQNLFEMLRVCAETLAFLWI